jgi:antitoxin MazE
MKQAIIGRWGDSLAIRFPADIAKAAHLDDGQRVEIVLKDDGLTIRKGPAELTVARLFEGKTPAQWRALYRDAFDWDGPAPRTSGPLR